MPSLWNKCLDRLESELTPQQFNTWIRPLHAVEEGNSLRLLAPNHYVRDWVYNNLANRITEVLSRVANSDGAKVIVQVGSRHTDYPPHDTPQQTWKAMNSPSNENHAVVRRRHTSGLRPGASNFWFMIALRRL